MNPNAAVFRPSSGSSKPIKLHSTANHHSSSVTNAALSHAHLKGTHQTSIATSNVRINQNILSPRLLQKQNQNIQQNIQLPFTSLLTAYSASNALSPNHINNNTAHNHHHHETIQTNGTTMSYQQLAQIQAACNIQNQQLIYQHMQQLTEQGQQLHIRINSVLQPQLSELSEQMQTALFNCNHVTQPEYYAGLQNQHLILTQSMKETQQQYNAVTYQYQYYQHILLQTQQTQQQQHKQQQQHNATTLQQQYQELQQLFDVSDNNDINMSKSTDKYTETVPNLNQNIKNFSNKKPKHPSTKQDIFERKLCTLICKLSPERFDKVLAKMLEFLDHHVQTQNELKLIVDKVLKFTLNQPYLASLTAKLFLHFYDYLPRLIMTQQYQQHLWDQNDTDISLTFRAILLVALEKLFEEFRGKIDIENKEKLKQKRHCKKYKQIDNKIDTIPVHSDDEDDDDEDDDDDSFSAEKMRLSADLLGLMEIIGELYNVDLVHIRVLRKGIFDSLLPAKLDEKYLFDVIDIDAICVVLKCCGKKLDLKEPRMVEKYLNKLGGCRCELRRFSDKSEAQTMIAEVRAIRSNNWVHHLHDRMGHNQKYKTVKYFQIPLDEIREEDDASLCGKKSDDARTDVCLSNQNGAGAHTGSGAAFSASPSPKPSASINVYFKTFGDSDGASTQFTLTRCYRYNAHKNCLELFVNNKIGFVKAIESGYLGSSYILGDEGRLLVCGSNKFGELGIQNEIIYIILKYWAGNHHLHRDISYLICTFIDSIRYRCCYIDKSEAKCISNDLMDDGRLISSGISSRHRFILTNSHQLYGAGCNTFNQLGTDSYNCNSYNIDRDRDRHEMDAMQMKTYWVKINYFAQNDIKLRHIECGYSTSTFLSEEGSIYTVGYSSFGNLGIGDKQNKLSKITKIYTVKTKILSISCGFDHTLAINEYRYVLSFGDNGFGQLGHGHTIQNRRQKPKEIEYFHKHNLHAIEICCGAFHSVVLDCSGLIHCFGYNLGFQCHYHNEDGDCNISTPKLNNTLHNIDKITNIKCGAFHNVVETQQNEWYLWGDNRNKQCLLYDSKAPFVKIPTKYHEKDIPNNETIIDMFPGYDETIVFTTRLTL